MSCRVVAFSAFLLAVFIVATWHSVESNRVRYRKPVARYPKDTPFWVTDFFVKGCKNFLTNCPHVYKYQPICGRDYNGDFMDFDSYCEMQYENCNTWRNWHVYKRERC